MIGPTGMAAGPMILPTPASKHTHKAPKRTSVCFSDHSSIQASEPNKRSHATSQRDTIHHEIAGRVSVSSEGPSYQPLSPILSATRIGGHTNTDDMMTSTSLLVLPSNNPSYDWALFFRSTGPGTVPGEVVDYARPSATEKQKRTSSFPGPFRLFKPRDKRRSQAFVKQGEKALSRRNDERVPNRSISAQAEPKVTASGSSYLQIIAETPKEQCREIPSEDPGQHEILESRVSVMITDSLDDWNALLHTEVEREERDRNASGQTVRMVAATDDAPVRPSASPRHSIREDSAKELPKDGPLIRWDRIQIDTPLHSNPVAPPAKAFDSPTALPPIPPTSPLMHTTSPSRSRSLFETGSPTVSGRAAVPSSSSRRVPPPGPLSRLSIRSSSSPGPPPPKSLLRTNRHSGILDAFLETFDDVPQCDDPDKHSFAHDQSLKAVPYNDLPQGDQQRSSGSTGSSTTTHISTGRRWIASRARAQEVPVVSVVVKSKAAPPKTKRVLRRARGTPIMEEQARINKRMSVQQTEHRLSASTVGGAMGHKIVIPVPHNVSSGPRPRSARMPRRSQRSLKGKSPDRTPSPPPKDEMPKKTSGVSPMVIDPSLPSPPPKRDLPPTPRNKNLARNRRDSASSKYSVGSASCLKATPPRPLRTRKKVHLPQKLDIDKMAKKFPSPPSSAKSTAPLPPLSGQKPHLISQWTGAGNAAYSSRASAETPMTSPKVELTRSMSHGSAQLREFMIDRGQEEDEHQNEPDSQQLLVVHSFAATTDDQTFHADTAATPPQPTAAPQSAVEAQLAALQYQNQMLQAALSAMLNFNNTAATDTGPTALNPLAAALGAMSTPATHPPPTSNVPTNARPTEQQSHPTTEAHSASDGLQKRDMSTRSLAAQHAALDSDRRSQSPEPGQSGSRHDSDRTVHQNEIKCEEMEKGRAHIEPGGSRVVSASGDSALDDYLLTRGRLDTSSLDFS